MIKTYAYTHYIGEIYTPFFIYIRVVGNCMTEIKQKINLFWNRICYNFEIITEFEMKKIVYRIFGNPIVPANTGLVGSIDGRLFIDKAVFFARKDVQSVIKSVKESKAVKEQIEKSKKNLLENAL